MIEARTRARGRSVVRAWPAVTIIVAVAGAALLTGCANRDLAISGSSHVVPSASSSNTVHLRETVYHPGDCVTWDQSAQDDSVDGRATRVVPCRSSHLVEVVAKALMITGFEGTVPDQATLSRYADGHCADPARQFLGYPLDPYGRFSVGSILPTQRGWVQGDRTLWCVVQLAEKGPADGLFTGDVRGADQTLRWPVGTCLPEGSNAPVACTQPHNVEITGTVTLPRTLTALPATPAGWQAVVGDRCRALGTRYVGGSHPAGVEEGWLPLQPSSWAAGERTVQCVVGSSAGNAWAVVRRSLHHS